MVNFIINNLIGFAIIVYFKPYLDIVKNYEIHQGHSLEQINNVYNIYLLVGTIFLAMVVYGLRALFKFTTNKIFSE